MIRFPNEAQFAFTILDDTDDARLENTQPFYDLLSELGMRTTKTVWPVACPEGSRDFFAGHTMAEPAYLAYCQELQRRGFELTWHCATMETSRRVRTVEGLAAFREQFGHYPALHANHAMNQENVYWGSGRYRSALRWAAALAFRNHVRFLGDEEGSEFFWGDLCLQHCRFVRNFTFRKLNTLRCDPHMPYRLSSTPWVAYWFSGSDAPNAAAFARLVTRAGLDELRAERGVCIVATHVGKGFVQGSRVAPEIEDALRYCASLPGWFATTSEILEHLLRNGAGSILSSWKLLALELRHATDRIGSA